MLHEYEADWTAATKPGIYQIQQNFVGNRSAITHVPPPQHEVPKLMEELNQWMGDPSFDALPLSMQISLSHYQFETIHPFPDGNGWTGRAMNAALAHRASAGGAPMPWTMSLHLLCEQADYYQILQEPRDTGNWRNLIEYFDKCLSNDAMRWRRILQQLESTFNGWNTAPLPQRTRQTLPSLLANPYVTTWRIARERQVSSTTARAILNDLKGDGIVEEAPSSHNTKIYVATAVATAVGFPI